MINESIHACPPGGKEKKRQEADVQGLYLKVNLRSRNSYGKLAPSTVLEHTRSTMNIS